MAYVVSATWTAEPGQEDVVLDAIEKLTPPSREEAGQPSSTRPTRTRPSPRSSGSSRSTRTRTRTPRTAPRTTSSSTRLEQAIPVLANRERAFYETIG